MKNTAFEEVQRFHTDDAAVTLNVKDFYAFGRRNNRVEQAHLLFHLLREIDKRGYTAIYAPLPAKDGIGLALYNRMIRAAAHQIIKL